MSGAAVDLAPFAERRRRFAEAIGDALAIIPAAGGALGAPPATPPAARAAPRNADTNFEFRQDSDFYFLTGFDEPDAVAVINPSHAKERFVLFVRPRDREMEIWNGRRAGVEGAIATYGADAAYTVDQLDAKLRGIRWIGRASSTGSEPAPRRPGHVSSRRPGACGRADS
jgi:Xaa-Pro aminopeptidase